MDGRPEIATEIGRITVRWAALDLLLVQILGTVLKNQVAAHTIIFAEQNAGQQRFQAFERVVGSSDLDTSTRKLIIDRMRQIRSLYRKRNAIVHEPLNGRFVIEGKKTLRSQVVAIDRYGKHRDISIEDFKAHAAEVDKHLSFLENISLEISPPELDDVAHDTLLQDDEGFQ